MKVFNMRRLRRERGLSQQKLAEILGIPQSSISSMEKGKNRIAPDYIATCATTFNIDPNDYMEDEKMVFVDIKGSHNVGNGENNDVGMTPETIKLLTSVESQLIKTNNRSEEQREKISDKVNLLHEENAKLIRYVSYLQLTLAKAGIEFMEEKEYYKSLMRN